MSNNKKKILIHVGFPKAASTLLQQAILCQSELGFVPVTGNTDDAASVDAFSYFVKQNDFAFSSELCKKLFWTKIKENVPPSKVAVISQEQLVGNPEKGVYHGKATADRIYSVFPDASILIIVREQCKYALSCYNERIRSGSNISLRRFIGTTGTFTKGYEPILDPVFLEYDRLVHYYKKVFGINNVLVLPFEKLVCSTSDCLKSIQDFLDLDHVGFFSQFPKFNKGEGIATVRLRRFMNTFAGEAHAFSPYKNAFTWKPISGLTKLFEYALPNSIQVAQKKKFMKIIRDTYGNRFAESNRRLEKLININLKEYSYML